MNHGILLPQPFRSTAMLTAAQMEEMPKMELNTWLDNTINGMVVELRTIVHGHFHPTETREVNEHIYYNTPATWWQAFKLSAIEGGNPFFNPKKIKWTVHRVDFSASIDLRPFTAFPEMPWVPPDSLGKPVKIWLQSDVRSQVKQRIV